MDSSDLKPSTFAEDSCLWPRRLLHIETLRSYERQPGNIYGGHVCPEYNALSYTWGRLQLEENEMPDVKAIDIKQTSWTIPRIDPNHFTAERFAAVIADCASPHPFERNGVTVEFLWLDVACIDKTPGSREKALEIGRQTKIFRRAETVFVWLTTHDRSFYLSWYSELENYYVDQTCRTRGIPATEAATRNWSMEVTMILADFLADPWFSSLWTLQEAFLRPNATIIPGDAMKTDLGLIRLADITSFLSDIRYQSMIFNEKWKSNTKIGLATMIDQTGLLVCSDQDLMGLLTAASTRITRHEEDRVYGIMQVFGFQFGSSAPDSDAQRQFSLAELSDQFGSALLGEYPVLSQMHIHQDRIEPSKGWRLSQKSTVPLQLKKFHRDKPVRPSFETFAILSSEQVQGALWGKFSGPTTPFGPFRQRHLRSWPEAWDTSPSSAYIDRFMEWDLLWKDDHHLTLLLDWQMLDECPPDYRNRGSSQAAFLRSHVPDLIILLLGTQTLTCDEYSKSQRHAIGLLLRPRILSLDQGKLIEIGTWERVGLFTWIVSDIKDDVLFKDLTGNGPCWTHGTGFFG